MTPPPPRSTLFPYTTLFRSSVALGVHRRDFLGARTGHRPRAAGTASGLAHRGGARSEEHTSELQSRGHLVCRLLLEKKKQDTSSANRPRASRILCSRLS